MFEATVDRSRTSESLNAFLLIDSRLIVPMTRSPARIGTPSHDSVGVPMLMAPTASASAPVCEKDGLSSLDDLGREPLAERHLRHLVTRPLVEPEGKLDPAGWLVVEGDGHRLDGEDLAHLFADRVDDGLEVELSCQGIADLVDDRQLSIALARLLDCTSARKGVAMCCPTKMRRSLS